MHHRSTLVCFIFNQQSKFGGKMLSKPENQTYKWANTGLIRLEKCHHDDLMSSQHPDLTLVSYHFFGWNNRSALLASLSHRDALAGKMGEMWMQAIGRPGRWVIVLLRGAMQLDPRYAQPWSSCLRKRKLRSITKMNNCEIRSRVALQIKIVSAFSDTSVAKKLFLAIQKHHVIGWWRCYMPGQEHKRKDG